MLAIALTLMIGCDGGGVGVGGDGDPTDDTGDTGPVDDVTCPVIDHTPIETSKPIGEPVPVSAVVTDDHAGVKVVELHYKKETTTTWQSLIMSETAQDTYSVDIPGSGVGSGGMDYYIEAKDNDLNGCTLPKDGEDGPFHFRVDGG